MSKLRVGLLNVAYSPNLGDGLIAECMRFGLTGGHADLEVVLIDLAGRDDFATGLKKKQFYGAIQSALPPVLRRLAARVFLELLIRSRLKAFYRGKMSQIDALVVGGGNLIADHDLNFPKKIHAALEAARERHLPVHIWAVGASAGWSKTGARLFRDAFARSDIRSISVRDERSQQLLERLLPTAQKPLEVAVVPDPGLCASLAVPASPPRSSANEAPPFAIGIMSAKELRYHGATALTNDRLIQIYSSIADEMLACGRRVNIFTNGNPDDREFAQRFMQFRENTGQGNPRLTDCSPEIQTPTDLCRFIQAQGGIVAFRMHAVVAAFSYRVPFVALMWDKKVVEFLKQIDKPDCLFEPHSTSAADVVEACWRKPAVWTRPAMPLPPGKR
ncbi:MAG: polysaccharide pyruvyl transferase family protein [Burkholderiaceae bacterium]